MKKTHSLFFLIITVQLSAQTILPPAMPWKGKSESLIAKPNNPWITTIEKTNFTTTPSYDETMTWFYSKTKYYDERYLLYPVGRQL